jgi:hypothetical protein
MPPSQLRRLETMVQGRNATKGVCASSFELLQMPLTAATAPELSPASLAPTSRKCIHTALAVGRR